MKRQMRSALSQSEDVNTSDDATTDCVQCAQCCMGQLVCVRLVVHVVIHNALNVSENVLVVVHNVP